MKPLDRRIALLIAVPGMAACVFAAVSFLLTIARNGLPFAQRPFFQEHYIAVGRAYSQAFAVGFFFCFFLILAAVAIFAELGNRRREVAPASIDPAR